MLIFLATSANLAWDGIESGIAGETRGSIRAIEMVAKGETDIGETFDVIAEQGLVAGGGALGGYGVRKGVLRSKLKGKLKPRRICKRSAAFEELPPMFTNNVELPQFALESLPSSIHDLENIEWNNVDTSIGAIFSIFLMIKMMLSGHLKVKPIVHDACSAILPTLPIEVLIYCLVNRF